MQERTRKGLLQEICQTSTQERSQYEEVCLDNDVPWGYAGDRVLKLTKVSSFLVGAYMLLARLAGIAPQTKTASLLVAIVLIWATISLSADRTRADVQESSLLDNQLSDTDSQSEEPPDAQPDDETPICETVHLYYVWEPQALKDLLASIKETFAPDAQIAETGGIGAGALHCGQQQARKRYLN